MADAPDETTPRASDVGADVSSGEPIQAGPRWRLAHIEETVTTMRLSYDNILGPKS